MPRDIERREERLEDVRQTGRIDADPAVLHLEDAAALGGPANPEADAAAIGGELDRIEQQVLQDVADHGWLDAHGAQIGGEVQFQLLTSLPDERPYLLRRLGGERGQLDLASFQGPVGATDA